MVVDAETVIRHTLRGVLEEKGVAIAGMVTVDWVGPVVEVELSRWVCPECAKKLYPEQWEEIERAGG
jgi:hypothetical protein